MTIDSTTTAKELAEFALSQKPDKRYAYNDRGDAVAGWSNEHWTVCAIKGIDGNWYAWKQELIINGKPVHHGKYIEVIV